MKYILLCGGSGKRLQSSSAFPKPLNHVLGLHSVQYVLDSIPSDEITIIVNKDLPDFSFQETLYQLSKKTLHFITLDRYTRGPVETAYLGVQKMNIADSEPICFFDNDTLYDLGNEVLPSTSTFIGYSTLPETDTEKKPYCFLEIVDSRLQKITEKVQISRNYACGIYSFETISLFLQVAKELMNENVTYNNEFYMSLLYDRLLKKTHPITCVPVKHSLCIGTPEDIQKNFHSLPFKPLRICFDLDNTLVRYKTPGQTYNDVDILEKNVYLLRQLKAMGHTIILHTARGMKTHQRNQGKAMAAVAKQTFENLEHHDIPYDEIYFGKPDADLYIDDKAFNPYALHFLESIGFGFLNESYLREKQGITGSSSNKFNFIYRKGDRIYKRGPASSMTGEVFFYKQVQNTPIATFFPKYISDIKDAESQLLVLEYVEGLTLFDLLKDGLFTQHHLDLVFSSLDTIHSYDGLRVTLDSAPIYENYMGKLKKRSLNHADYPFSNTQEILATIDPIIQEYLRSNSYKPCSVVHGDSWFSNTLITKNSSIVFLDMKGDINGTLTTNGDELTDFGKIFQSLLGFDAILHNVSVDESYMRSLRSHFLQKLQQKGVPMHTFFAVTACLIGKTLSFMSVDLEVRTKIWNLIESLVTCLNTNTYSL